VITLIRMLGMFCRSTLLKLSVPVSHRFAGIVGLIGLFVGSAPADVVAKPLAE
jgi:hypothetical protein